MPETLHLDPRLAVDVGRAARLLRGGGTVAFPTETVYGLGANALDAVAVARIFAAKGRPAWDPLIVHIAHMDQLRDVADVPEDLEERVLELAAAFWPGPLTLLLPRGPGIPDSVTAGRALVGVRIPEHAVALALLEAAGVPVAAPSANRFGHTSPTTAAHVFADLDGRIDAVLDGGATRVGVESTVLDPERMVIYRPGAVTAEQIHGVVGEEPTMYVPVEMSGEPEALPSPGVGIRHYAPRARLMLCEGNEAGLVAAVAECVDEGPVGVLLPEGWQLSRCEGVRVFDWGSWGDSDQLAARLFAGLRTLDDAGVERIVCPVPEAGGVGTAIRDRLEKAARTAQDLPGTMDGHS